jgi:hypothetical protein
MEDCPVSGFDQSEKRVQVIFGTLGQLRIDQGEHKT